MTKRKDFRSLLILATLAGLALIGLLIDLSGTSRPGDGQTQTELSDRSARLVHQNFQQAVAMLHAGHYELAAQSLHAVLVSQPRMPEAHVNMGYALLGLGKHLAARDFFTSAAEIRPSQYNAYYGLAAANEELGDLVAAVSAMKIFVHIAPTEDPFRRKAESALWEWETALARQAP